MGCLKNIGKGYHLGVIHGLVHHNAGIAFGNVRIAELLSLQSRIALLDVFPGQGVNQHGVGRNLALKGEVAAEGILEAEFVHHQKIIVDLEVNGALDLLAAAIIVTLGKAHDAVIGSFGGYIIADGYGGHSQLRGGIGHGYRIVLQGVSLTGLRSLAVLGHIHKNGLAGIVKIPPGIQIREETVQLLGISGIDGGTDQSQSIVRHAVKTVRARC